MNQLGSTIREILWTASPLAWQILTSRFMLVDPKWPSTNSVIGHIGVCGVFGSSWTVHSIGPGYCGKSRRNVALTVGYEKYKGKGSSLKTSTVLLRSMYHFHFIWKWDIDFLCITVTLVDDIIYRWISDKSTSILVNAKLKPFFCSLAFTQIKYKF